MKDSTTTLLPFLATIGILLVVLYFFKILAFIAVLIRFGFLIGFPLFATAAGIVLILVSRHSQKRQK